MRIASQALRYRMTTVHDPATASRFDPDELAEFAVECGDPVVDAAIRRIGSAWLDAGLEPDGLVETWPADLIDLRFAGDPTLLDAIDDIVRAAHRVQFSRRRGHSPDQRPQVSDQTFFANSTWARSIR